MPASIKAALKKLWPPITSGAVTGGRALKTAGRTTFRKDSSFRRWSLATYPVVLAYALVVLSVPARGQPDDLVPAWRRFLNAVSESAQGTVARADSQEGHSDLAKRVVKDLNVMEDPINNLKGSQFGVAYSALVWSYKIPASHADVITDSRRQIKFPVTGKLSVSSGMIPYEYCQRGYTLKPLGEQGKEGKFGWACVTGGSTGFEDPSQGRNCMVFFRPHDVVERSESDAAKRSARTGAAMRKWLTTSINYCTEKEFPRFRDPDAPKIGLTALAECIYMNYPKIGRIDARTKLKGVVALPGVPVVATYQLYALESPLGHLIEEQLSITPKSKSSDSVSRSSHAMPDLNVEPSVLFVIAALI